MKLLTVTVPCYNSAAYMVRCIDSLLPGGDALEIIVVDDGSTDETGTIADGYATRYPDRVRVIHQPNGGHGEGINQGLAHAKGLYFKVVDSDDRLEASALDKLMATLRELSALDAPPDLIVHNYVYDRAEQNAVFGQLPRCDAP